MKKRRVKKKKNIQAKFIFFEIIKNQIHNCLVYLNILLLLSNIFYLLIFVFIMFYILYSKQLKKSFPYYRSHILLQFLQKDKRHFQYQTLIFFSWHGLPSFKLVKLKTVPPTKLLEFSLVKFFVVLFLDFFLK